MYLIKQGKTNFMLKGNNFKRIKNLFTETSGSELDLELFYTVCKSKKVDTLFTNFLFITKHGGAII